MAEWLNINYREFWDVPRIFFTEHAGRLYLFDCQFDRDREDYPESYQVFLVPQLTAADYAGSWEGLWHRAIAKLGDVPISAVRFDPTKRAAIDASVFDVIRPTIPVANGALATDARAGSPVS